MRMQWLTCITIPHKVSIRIPSPDEEPMFATLGGRGSHPTHLRIVQVGVAVVQRRDVHRDDALVVIRRAYKVELTRGHVPGEEEEHLCRCRQLERRGGEPVVLLRVYCPANTICCVLWVLKSLGSNCASAALSTLKADRLPRTPRPQCQEGA